MIFNQETQNQDPKTEDGVILMAKSGARAHCGGIALSLCDGMGCAAQEFQSKGIEISRYIGVEIDPVAQKIGDNANPKTTTFPGIDHSWHCDIAQITEDDIKSLGENNISYVTFGTPCENFSKLLFLARSKKSKPKPGVDPRTGLRGKTGRLILVAARIWSWVLKYNPRARGFGEFIDISGHPDYDEICKFLGKPYLIDASKHSYTKRNRMYWCLNWDPPADFKDAHAPKLNVDECMDKGRSIVRYEAHGTTWVKPIGKSWKGDPHQPRADTRVPVLVRDDDCDELQHLRPHEAQLLMGMKKGITSGPSTTPKEELKAIGNG